MFIKTQREIRLTDSNVESFELLPNGTYLTKYDAQINEYYLELTEDFTIPNKIYGNSEILSDRYTHTFKNSNKSMGILLTGLKGTGKSLTAKLTAIKADIPVILVTEQFKGEQFKSFLNGIKQSVSIFIDEFEKVYHEKNAQDSLLSLLDGIFECKKMFIFTSNMVEKINEYMLNRPGRIRYLVEYESLDESVINEVIEDMLSDKSKRDELLDVIDILGNISMDSLVGIIGEINMYGETAKTVVKYLNIRPEASTYNMSIIINGEKVGSTSIRNHPLRLVDTYIEYYHNTTKSWEDIPLKISEWEVMREGKNVTMKKDAYVLHFTPYKSVKLEF
jgi:broad-specificity NMP kinase